MVVVEVQGSNSGDFELWLMLVVTGDDDVDSRSVGVVCGC